MRYIFTPEELTLPSLLPLDLLDGRVREALQRVHQAALQLCGKEEAAWLSLLERLTFQQQTAWAQQRRYTYAIYTLYRADLLRRQCRWEEALREVELALPWLQSRVETDARYEEAVAFYFIGMLHYRLYADDAALDALARAQALIQQEMEDWQFRLESHKLAVGKRVLRWIEGVMALRSATSPFQQRFIVPLYQPPASFPTLIPVAIPAQDDGAFSPAGRWSCRLLEAFPLCPWGKHYFALQLSEEGYPLLPGGHPGDLVVMAWPASVPLTSETVFAVRKFRRYSSGQIVWEDADFALLKLQGTPCMHCRVEASLARPQLSLAGGTG